MGLTLTLRQHRNLCARYRSYNDAVQLHNGKRSMPYGWRRIYDSAIASPMSNWLIPVRHHLRMTSTGGSKIAHTVDRPKGSSRTKPLSQTSVVSTWQKAHCTHNTPQLKHGTGGKNNVLDFHHPPNHPRHDLDHCTEKLDWHFRLFMSHCPYT
jgi:hypothetical protein